MGAADNLQGLLEVAVRRKRPAIGSEQAPVVGICNRRLLQHGDRLFAVPRGPQAPGVGELRLGILPAGWSGSARPKRPRPGRSPRGRSTGPAPPRRGRIVGSEIGWGKQPASARAAATGTMRLASINVAGRDRLRGAWQEGTGHSGCNSGTRFGLPWRNIPLTLTEGQGDPPRLPARRQAGHHRPHLEESTFPSVRLAGR